MRCRLSDLCNKEVIHIEKGIRIGYIDDVEVDIESCKLISIVIYGRAKFWGLFGREDDIIIMWDQIEVIGKDTVLVNCKYSPRKKGTKWKLIGELFK